jgi:hypothetical protein
VWRVKLLRLGDEDHMLLRTMHHIVSDGWSEGVFNREFRLLYEAYREGRENPLQPLTVQYADYTLWQRAWLDEGRLADEMEYWKRQLAGIPEWLELPTDRARPAMQTFEADVYRATLTAEQTEGLKRVSRKNQATLYMTLLAALAVLLSRYSGQEDVVVGSPIANREDERLEEMIGLFVNKLVMRVRIRGEMSFTDLVRDVRRTALEAYEHQDMPFERIVEELSPERSLSRTPIFQVSFQLQNAPRVIPELEKIEVTRVVINELLVRHDLEILASEREGTIAIRWMYRRDLFDMSRIAQMATHYVRVLEAMLKDEDQ